MQEKCRTLEEAAEALRQSDARQDERIAALRGETQEFSAAVTEKIDSGLAELRESDARQAAELSTRIEALRGELGIQQEDIEAIKSALSSAGSRIDAVLERLDKQAEALRTMYSNYAQRETELEQLVQGLARFKSFPAAQPAPEL